MCNSACISFVTDQLKEVSLSGKKILEVGSFNVNGSVSIPLKQRKPNMYLGVDMAPGPGVDMICNVYDIVNFFGSNSFDIVITTEMLEHVKDWRLAVNNLKSVCKHGGHILITTRSKGFPLHGYPEDHWRFEISDMQNIFNDFEIVNIVSDWNDVGVLVHVKKPNYYLPKDLTDVKLYNINSDKVE